MTANGNQPKLPFVDRVPTPVELEIFRLCLSTFQDGSGQLRVGSRTLPGWRDFERTVAEVTHGVCTEDKGIFDVLCEASPSNGLAGLSCKMRKELSRIMKDGRITIELSNSNKKMWEAMGVVGITTENYKAHANKVGCTLITLVKQWHEAAATHRGQVVDKSRSGYLALLWDQKTDRYQLYKFPLDLPNPSKLKWYFIASSSGSRATGHLNGDASDGGRVFEWYGESGGQLKYYPHFKDALWKTPVFKLEPIPAAVTHTLAGKAASYFPELWKAAMSETRR